MREDDDGVVPLSMEAIAALGLSTEVRAALHGIQAELTAAYQKNFVEMVETMRRQASALDRMQTTLNLLVQHVAPQIRDRIPLAVTPVSEAEHADLPSAVVVADPIAMGYTLTQANLAEALGLSQGDVSELVRAFKLNDEDDCAVTVRKGKRGNIVNYHPRAIDRFRECVAEPPEDLHPNQRSALKRVTAILVTGKPADP
jgi:hypothetical protein